MPFLSQVSGGSLISIFHSHDLTLRVFVGVILRDLSQNEDFPVTTHLLFYIFEEEGNDWERNWKMVGLQRQVIFVKFVGLQSWDWETVPCGVVWHAGWGRGAY